MQVNLNKSIVLGVDTRDLRIAQTGARTYLTELIHAWQQMPGVQLVLLDNARGVYRGKNKGLKLLAPAFFLVETSTASFISAP